MKKILVGLMATAFAAYSYAATTTAKVAPTSGSSISAPVTAVAPTPSKIKLSYVAENAVEMAAAHRGNTSDDFNSQQHVGIKYDLGDKKSIQYRQYFHYNQTDSTTTDEWSLGDHVVQYVDGTAAKVAGADMAFIARLYLPGTELTREIGKYELRLTPTVEQQITGKLKVEYLVSTRLFAYTGSDDGQRGLRVLPAVALEYAANSVFTPYVGAFTDHSWKHNGAGVALYGPRAGTSSNPANYTETFYTDIGTKIALAKTVELNVYVETNKDMRSQKNYDIRNEDNSSYNLELSASL